MGHTSMKISKNLPAMVLAILLAACLFTYYSTRDSAKPAVPQRKSVAAERALVDTSRLQTALKLAPLAATPDEQGQAHEAWRLQTTNSTSASPRPCAKPKPKPQRRCPPAVPCGS
jgi:hypothetical protein